MSDAIVASSPWTNKRFKTANDNVATRDVEEITLRVLRRHTGEPTAELLKDFNKEYQRPVFSVDGTLGASDGISKAMETWEPDKPQLLYLMLSAWDAENKLADGEAAEFHLGGRVKLNTRFASSFVLFPLDALKTKAQSGNAKENRSTLALIAKVHRDEGMAGFFRGAQWRGFQSFCEKFGFFCKIEMLSSRRYGSR